MADEPTQKKDYRCPRCGKRFTAEVVWKPSPRAGGRSFAEVIIPAHKFHFDRDTCPASRQAHTIWAAVGEVEAVG